MEIKEKLKFHYCCAPFLFALLLNGCGTIMGLGGPRSGAINLSTGEYFVPSGNGEYTGTRDGRIYAPAGPNGVLDTQTGIIIPIIPINR